MPTTLLRDPSVLVPAARSALAAQALFKHCSGPLTSDVLTGDWAWYGDVVTEP